MQLNDVSRVASAICGAVALAFALPRLAAARGDATIVPKINHAAATSKVVVHPLRANVSELEGSGGNIAVLNGAGGKFMVDAGIAISREQISAALNKLGPGSVKYVVNTHWHWDHSDGDAWLHDAGATIVATPATARYLSSASRVELWLHTFPPVAPSGLPTELLTGEAQYKIDDETVLVHPLNPAHTDGDIYVYFKTADVLVTGDIFWNGMYPFIDDEHGGGIDGTIGAVDELLRVATAHTMVVPGHGPVGTRAELLEFRGMLVAVRDQVLSLKRQGKSLADVVASKPTSAFDAKYGRAIVGPALFTEIVYNAL